LAWKIVHLLELEPFQRLLPHIGYACRQNAFYNKVISVRFDESTPEYRELAAELSDSPLLFYQSVMIAPMQALTRLPMTLRQVATYVSKAGQEDASLLITKFTEKLEVLTKKINDNLEYQDSQFPVAPLPPSPERAPTPEPSPPPSPRGFSCFFCSFGAS